MTINRSTLATIYQAFADCVTDMSIDPERLFTEAGLDFTRINDPEARFGTSEINQLRPLAKRETKTPVWSLRWLLRRLLLGLPLGVCNSWAS